MNLSINLRPLPNRKGMHCLVRILKTHRAVTVAAALYCLLMVPLHSSAQAKRGQLLDEAELPVPKDIPDQLFYLQRDPNTNTVIYQLNRDKAGEPVSEKPVNVFWIRYAAAGEKKELSNLQRKLAYGITHRYLGQSVYELKLTAYKKLLFHLKRSTLDNEYHVYANVNGTDIQLERIFLRIDGGTVFSPKIRYVEITGRDPQQPSRKITEHIRI